MFNIVNWSQFLQCRLWELDFRQILIPSSSRPSSLASGPLAAAQLGLETSSARLCAALASPDFVPGASPAHQPMMNP